MNHNSSNNVSREKQTCILTLALLEAILNQTVKSGKMSRETANYIIETLRAQAFDMVDTWT
jgi:hypothetical protein